MNGEILFLAHRLPFPPDRGDKIRSHHILHRLAQIAPVHAACFADDLGGLAHKDKLAGLTQSHCLTIRRKPLWQAGLEALAMRKPVSLAAFHDPRLSTYVWKVLAERPIETIYVFSGQMGQYVPAGYSGRVVLDLVDVDSAKFESYAQQGWVLRRWLHAREGRLLRAEEERLARRADRTLLVSEAEARLFRTRLSDPGAARIIALGNGIDARLFDPAIIPKAPAMVFASGPHCVFTGQMDYPPNVAAALRLVERIMPIIRQSYPDAQCHIVGRAPTAELWAHDGRDGCRIWGEVDDIRPYIAGADLVFAPLDIARGVQNKVLEAMALARPVLLTPGAATGIGAEDGVELAIEDSDRGFAERAIMLFRNPLAALTMGAAARRFILERNSWQRMLLPFDAIIRGEMVRKSRRDAA